MKEKRTDMLVGIFLFVGLLVLGGIIIRFGSFSLGDTGTGSFTIVIGAGEGGSNACGDAEPIEGDGVFGFDMRGSTLDGVFDPACVDTGEFLSDVWFCWTAACDGIAVRHCTRWPRRPVSRCPI